MRPESPFAAISSYWAAVEGDTRPLEQRLRARVDLSNAEKDFLADLLAGKRPSNPKLRVKSDAKTLRENAALYVGISMLIEPDLQKKAVVSIAAEKFGVSTRTVYAGLAQIKGSPRFEWEIAWAAGQVTGKYPVPRLAPESKTAQAKSAER